MEDAKEFLSALFEHATRNCVVSYANDRNAKIKPVQRYGLTGAQIVDFIKQYDVPGRAVYACTADIPHGVRNKINAGGTLAAFADLDFKDVAHPRVAILEAIALLPLRPSFVNDTGNGFHVWWMFDEPVTDKERVERLLRDIASVMAGDPHVCEVSRVMRIPSTHNSKDGANHLVRIVERNDKRYSIDELEEYFAHVMPLLLRRAKSATVPPTEKRSALERLSEINQAYGVKAGRINTDEWWANLRYPGNVNETIVKVTSSMLSTGVPVDEVVQTVLDEVWERVGEIEGWDYREEHNKIKEECLRWMVKKPDVMAGQREHGLPQWIAKDGRVKAAIRRAEATPIEETPEQTAERRAHNKALNGSHKLNGSTPHAPKNNASAASAEALPADLWDTFPSPKLPDGVLPPIIEAFAKAQSRLKGCDPAGLAMGALTACAAAIPDSIRLKVKVHDVWTESARLWVAMVGDVSVLKSPIFTEVTRELDRIDDELVQQSAAARAAWEEGGKEGPEPPRHRLVLMDPTPEAAGEIAMDNPDGLILARDEISAWFGNMEKYSNAGRGGASGDKGFWLQAYDGKRYTFDRIKRGSGRIEHLGVCLLGGIQPDVIRKQADIGTEDGLIQRINPIVMEPSVDELDEPMTVEGMQFDKLVRELYNMPRQTFGTLSFTPEAQRLRNDLSRTHRELRDNFKTFNTKLAGHIGKYNGMFARLCLIFHCIENHGAVMGDIDVDTARRAKTLLHSFLLPHAVKFYLGTLGVADNNDRLLAVANYILVHEQKFKTDKKNVTNRDVQVGVQTMRKLDRPDIERVFHQLEMLGWVTRGVSVRAGAPVQWSVNPKVYELFNSQTKDEKRRRMEAKERLDAIFIQIREDRRYQH